MTTAQFQLIQLRRRLAEKTRKLYDAKTSENERRDLSMRVAIIRQKLGVSLDNMMNASEEEESGS